jgi:hypothetical protein
MVHLLASVHYTRHKSIAEYHIPFSPKAGIDAAGLIDGSGLFVLLTTQDTPFGGWLSPKWILRIYGAIGIMNFCEAPV